MPPGGAARLANRKAAGEGLRGTGAGWGELGPGVLSAGGEIGSQVPIPEGEAEKWRCWDTHTPLRLGGMRRHWVGSPKLDTHAQASFLTQL